MKPTEDMLADALTLVAQHEETIGKLADVAKAARDAAEWMRAELRRTAQLARRSRQVAPSWSLVATEFERIAAGPPEDGTT